MIFLTLMNLLIKSFSFLCDSSEESFILPVHEPLFKFQQQYPNTESIGFGLWMKWQPLSLIDQIQMQSTIGYCQNQFIYMMYFTDNQQTNTIFLISREKIQNVNQLKIESDFFSLNENYMLDDNSDGNWIFIQSYFDFNLKKTTFTFYNLSYQQFYQINADFFPNFDTIISHQIGGTCQNCIIQGRLQCLSQFKGRITSVSYGNEKITEENINPYIQSCFSVIQDCKANNIQTLIEYINFTEIDYLLLFETQVMEIQIFQMTGWIVLFQLFSKDLPLTIFRITNNINEQLENYKEAVFLQYIILSKQTEIKLTSSEQYMSVFYETFNFLEVIQDWHYFELTIENFKNKNEASLRIFSYLLNEVIELRINAKLFTGIQNYIFIGGDYFSTVYFEGVISNLQFQNFCDPSQIQSNIHCDSLCSSCYGPYSHHCLSCSNENNRYLVLNECKCRLSTIDYFNTQKCYSIEETFEMLTITEEEIKCEKEGENFCIINDKIQCTFGYFLYENSCIKCPHFDQDKQNLVVYCLECIMNPTNFFDTLQCETDAIAYHYNQENVYEEIKKQKNEIENYEIIEIQEGQFELKLLVNSICIDGFYLKDNQCLSCGQFCDKCEIEEKCQQCKEGYYLNNYFSCDKCNLCEKCVIDQGNIICLTCPEKYYLNENSQCLPCGLNCANCRNNGFCNYCDDPQKYFISLDGINCNLCEIKNCKYCFQIQSSQFETITSLDINLEYTWSAYQNFKEKIQCLKCLKNYALDYSANSCLSITEINNSCLYGTYNLFSQFQCILDEYNCYSIYNCISCNENKCYNCIEGYYLDFFSNRCIPCPSQCKTCSKQSVQLKDFWKQEIQPFYDFLMNQLKITHNFNEYINSKYRDDYEIICLSCNQGFILLNFQCVQTCQEGCAQCEIINNQAKCIKCDEIDNQISKSVDKKEYCQICPSGCIACVDRDINEIEALNKYFSLSYEYNQYTRKCYSLDKNSQSLNLYTYQNIIVECYQYKRCLKRVLLQWNLYCDKQDYEKIDKVGNTKLSYDYYLDDFLKNEISFKIESPQLSNYFNSQSIQYIDINLNFISGTSNICDCKNGTKLQTGFMGTIFFIQQVKVQFLVRKPQTKLLNFNLEISGFSQIRFENLKLQSSKVSIDDHYYFWNKIKLVSFINCEVVESNDNAESEFTLISQALFNLNIFNFTITKINYTGKTMFQLSSTYDQEFFKINITNLTINYTRFSDGKFIFLKTKQDYNNIILFMKNIKVFHSSFHNSRIISSAEYLQFFLDLINIENLQIYQSNFNQSIVFYFPIVKILNFEQISLQKSNFTENSFLILSNQFTCLDFVMNDIIITDSYILSNVVDLQFQTSFQETIFISLKYIILDNILYNNFQCIVHLIQYEHFIIDLYVEYLRLTKLIFTGEVLLSKETDITNENAIINLNCQICTLKNIEIIREYSAPEISILNSQKIYLQNLRFTQKQQNHIWRYIHPSFDCLNNVYQLQKFFFLSIARFQDIEFENIVIEKAVSINYPFIQIQGYGLNEIRTFEKIIIKNSIFRNNIMIISSGQFTSSCISIQSEQLSNITILNNTFLQNHLNSHDQNQISILSTTIMINSKSSNLYLKNSLFQNNLITNSQSSNLYLNVASLEIQSTNFLQNNLINYQELINQILFDEDTSYVKLLDLQQKLSIQSEGGSGFIRASQINFENLSVIESYADKGGAFYLILHSSSSLHINNSIFQNNFASLLTSKSSKGGCLFIDAENSGIEAKMTNITFNNTFSRQSGGGVAYTNITFSKFQFQSELGVYLANLEKCQFIKFFAIEVINSVISNSPLLTMNFIPNYQGELLINNFQIHNLTEFNSNNISKQCKNLFLNSSINFYCKNPNINEASINMIDNSQEIFDNQYTCNQQQLQNTKKLNFSLIQITDIEQQHFIQFSNFTLSKISCSCCQYGLINFLNVQKSLENTIKLDEIIFSNCTCGHLSCLSIIQDESQISINNSNEGNRILSYQNSMVLQQSALFQVTLSDCQFIFNKANYGGALFISDIDIMIFQCQFLQNTAEYGGAIYFQKSNAKLSIIQSQITENQAQIAGGIFLQDSILQETQNMDVILMNNQATISPQDFQENPSSLVISIDDGKTFLQQQTTLYSKSSIIEQIIVKPYKLLGQKEKTEFLTFPSGLQISSYSYYDVYTSTIIRYDLTFRIIALNKFRQIDTLLEGKQCFLSHKVINSTNQQEVENYYAQLSINQVSFDNKTKDFNLDSLIIQFNPYYEKEIVLRIFIKCDFIQIPIYGKQPPYPIDNIITDYQIFLDVKTFPCQLGEYFNSTSGSCIQCDSSKSQYQVELNATICLFRDETKIEQVESQMIKLKPTFWRAYFYSSKIEECFHILENCLGGWKPGDYSCLQGHIGALCEQCDLYNVRGDGHYSISQPYKCGNCDQISGNIISIILISFWTLISILMSVNSTIQTTSYLKGSKFLGVFGIYCLNKKSSVAVLIKVFTNYLQIIQTISTFKLQFPNGLSSGIKSVGNPIEQMAYNFDCFLIQISDMTIIYFRIIWSLVIAFQYIFIYFILLAGGIFLKKVQYNISMVTTALIYTFIFLQPNIVQALISLVSYRVISDVSWISGNVSYRYDTSSHKLWILIFCFPLLFLFCLLIPGIMYFRIRGNKNKLDSIKIREAYGYLYNEYKQHAYFWEFIKIFQKEFIIIVLSFYDDHIAIKASLVFLCIFAYSFLTIKVRPYMTGELNKIDMQSTTICAISIIIGSSIYSAQVSNLMEVIYPFYMIIAILNGYFFLKIIIKILSGYYNQMHEQIDKIKQVISSKFKYKLQGYPQIQKLLESQKVKDTRIQKHYKKLKCYLFQEARRLLMFKKQSQKYIIFQKEIQFNTSENNTISNDIKAQQYPKNYQKFAI